MKRRICVAYATTEVEKLLDTNNALTLRQRTKLQLALDDAKANGFSVIPACDNHDERGVCRGHVILEENERP